MLIKLLNNEIDQQEYLKQHDVNVLYKQLPKKVYGFIYRYRDINVIVINNNISSKKKKLTLIHELAHLELHHLDKEIFEFDIEDIEDEADKYIEFLLNNNVGGIL